MMLGNWMSTFKRMMLDPSLKPNTKLNSRWNRDLYVRAKTIKLLEENTGEKLHCNGFGNDFLALTLKAEIMSTKNR